MEEEIKKLIENRLSFIISFLKLDQAILMNESQKIHLIKQVEKYNKDHGTYFITKDIKFRATKVPGDHKGSIQWLWSLNIESIHEKALSPKEKIVLWRNSQAVA